MSVGLSERSLNVFQWELIRSQKVRRIIEVVGLSRFGLSRLDCIYKIKTW
jgi:hypothetical protein